LIFNSDLQASVSFFTISETKAWKLTLGSQPSSSLAFDASPTQQCSQKLIGFGDCILKNKNCQMKNGSKTT
jgi:hypothetical protein